MVSLLETVQDELRALTGDILALAVRVPFGRVHDSEGRLVTVLVPSEEQRIASSRHQQRLHGWLTMVTSILRRRGCPGASTIAQCAADFEQYVCFSYHDAASVTEGAWRTTFARDVTHLSLKVACVVDENAEAFAVVRRRPEVQYEDFEVRLSE